MIQEARTTVHRIVTDYGEPRPAPPTPQRVTVTVLIDERGAIRLHVSPSTMPMAELQALLSTLTALVATDEIPIS